MFRSIDCEDVFLLSTLVVATWVSNLRPFLTMMMVSSLGFEQVAFVGSVQLWVYFFELFSLAIGSVVQKSTAQSVSFLSCVYPVLTGLMMLGFLALMAGGCMLVFPKVGLSYLIDVELTQVHVAYLFYRWLGFVFDGYANFAKCVYAGLGRGGMFACVNGVTLLVQSLITLVCFSYGGADQSLVLSLENTALIYMLASLSGCFVFLPDCVRSGFAFLHSKLSVSSCLNQCVKFFGLVVSSLFLAIYGVLDHLGTLQIYRLVDSSFGMMDTASMHWVFSCLGLVPGMGFAMAALTDISKQSCDESSCDSQIYTLGCQWVKKAYFYGGLMAVAGWLLWSQWLWWFNGSAMLVNSNGSMLTMLGSIPFHIACQVQMRKLQAIGGVSEAVMINLGFMYGFRLPMVILMAHYFSSAITGVWLVMLVEKILRSLVMLWRWKVFSGHQQQLSEIQLFSLKSTVGQSGRR